MKTIKISQCSVGKFNLFSNEETLSFFCSLYEDGKVYEENGIKAQLYYSGEASEIDEFQDLSNLENIFEKCYEYSDSIWSTVNYKEQCLLFARVYNENYEEIDGDLVVKHKEKVKKEIGYLQKQLEWNTIVPDISWTTDHVIKKEIHKHEKQIEYHFNKQKDLIPDSESWIKEQETIESYQRKINNLENNLIEI